MSTTSIVFFLIIGQAGGGYPESPGGMVVIPAHYDSQSECMLAGEASRSNNHELSYISYTCVPAPLNVEIGD